MLYYFKFMGYVFFFASILFTAFIILSWSGVLAKASDYPSWVILGTFVFFVMGYFLKKINPKEILNRFIH